MKNTSKKTTLREFRSTTTTALPTVVMALQKYLGQFYRVGGQSRVYTVDHMDQKAAIYAIGTGVSAVGIGWTHTPESVETIYFWSTLNLDKEPEYAIDLPEASDFTKLAPKIAEMLRSQQEGQVAV